MKKERIKFNRLYSSYKYHNIYVTIVITIKRYMNVNVSVKHQ